MWRNCLKVYFQTIVGAWRNWYTRTSQKRMGQPLGVRVSPRPQCLEMARTSQKRISQEVEVRVSPCPPIFLKSVSDYKNTSAVAYSPAATQSRMSEYKTKKREVPAFLFRLQIRQLVSTRLHLDSLRRKTVKRISANYMPMHDLQSLLCLIPIQRAERPTRI